MTTVDTCSSRSDASVNSPMFTHGNGGSLYHHSDASPPTLHPVNRSPSLFLGGMGSPLAMFDGGGNGSPLIYHHHGNESSSTMMNFHSGNTSTTNQSNTTENCSAFPEDRQDGIGVELLSQQQVSQQQQQVSQQQQLSQQQLSQHQLLIQQQQLSQQQLSQHQLLSQQLSQQLLSQQQQQSNEFFQQLLNGTPQQRSINGQNAESDNQNHNSGVVSMIGQEPRMLQTSEMVDMRGMELNVHGMPHHSDDDDGSMVASGASTAPANFGKQKKSDIPPPPKKPLSPYMRFSKANWQLVKAGNPCKTVCEVGADIGRLWRELGENEKQPYIDEFTADKLHYDMAMLEYFERTGLKPEDLVKPRIRGGNKKEGKQPPSSTSTTTTPRQTKKKGRATPTSAANNPATNGTAGDNQITHGGASNVTNQNFHNISSVTDLVGNGNGGTGNGSYAGDGDGMHVTANGLPSFSQVWSNQDLSLAQQHQLIAQMVNQHNAYQTADAQLRGALSGGSNEDGSQLANGVAFSNNNGIHMLNLQLAINQQRQQQQQQQQQLQFNGHNSSQQPVAGNNQQLPNAAAAAANHHQELDTTTTTENNNWPAMSWQQQFNAAVANSTEGGGGGNVAPHPPQTLVDVNQGRFMYKLQNEQTLAAQQRGGVNDLPPRNGILPTEMNYTNNDANGITGDALEVGEVRMHGVVIPQGAVGIPNGVNGARNHVEEGFGGFATVESMQFACPPAMNSLANNATLASVDSEILMLRNHLVEKSQEILELMKELEQAFGLIHQLKEQNQFFSQQWAVYVQQQQQLQQARLAEQVLSQKSTTTTSNGSTTGSS